ncbi:hypothetical protein HK414_05100 [Ramlibacter terrae]|uniref:Orc1-like AAA ATPase domain-containing protein n=1 Tax=Ramlibacter terrae TaxID=2732511 RepID=A0ABX6P2B3_9BURK|nr:hypothetical protein HK414_05100 [Ramlibacter terrae]
MPAEAEAPAALPPRALRERTITALVRWLIASAQRQPMLLLCEDLHWADPTTLEMMGELIEEMAASRLMAVMTFRPDFEPPWPQRSHVSHVTLARLSDAEAWRFAESALRGRNLSAPDLAQIVERADGVPMFIEELIAAVADRVPGSASPPPIPDTLQGSLMMRLDRLADAREIAQIGAAAGREFSYALLRAAAECDEETLQVALARTVGDDLLQRRGMPPDAIYRFRHALVRDAAYDSTLRTRRVQYHRRIAQALEQQFPGQAQAQPELVAHHHAEAGDRERAVAAAREAGERALNRCANEEALTHWAARANCSRSCR